MRLETVEDTRTEEERVRQGECVCVEWFEFLERLPARYAR